MYNLNLDDIVNVEVSTSGYTPTRDGFNTGLILGPSARIGAKRRIMDFANLAEMVDAGFENTDPEYKAAALYFAQTPRPSRVCIGRRIASTVSEAASATVSGTGITAATVTAATFGTKVEGYDGKYTFDYDGTNWLFAGSAVTLSNYGISTTGTAAAGDAIVVAYNAAATAESNVDALTDCRAKNASWYGVYVVAASGNRVTNSEIVAIAEWVDTIIGCLFADVNTSAVSGGYPVSTAKRFVLLQSETMYAAAALMGYAMGANTGEADSAYTLAYKSLAGITPDDYGPSTIAACKDANTNYYVLRAATYAVLEPGVCYDGLWFDERIGIDQLARDLQVACVEVLTGATSKIPYTDAGALNFVLACNDACADAVRCGFLTPGIWNGPSVLDLDTGDTLTAGYYCQAEPVSAQSAENRASRIAPPIFVSAILAGAIHFVNVKVTVD